MEIRGISKKKKKRGGGIEVEEEMITEGVGTFLAPTQLFTQNWPDIDGFSMHELSSSWFFSLSRLSLSLWSFCDVVLDRTQPQGCYTAAILHDGRSDKFPRP